jgi:4-amino-4-deoxy-L-arabinose transferase-like glycosyltransferase
MTTSPATRRAAGLAALALMIHGVAVVVSPYELHRDELLYAAMGTHLDWWRMDFPPLIGALANAQRWALGDSAWALRMLPALAHAMLVWLAVDTARRLGGTPSAQWLAGGCVVANALFLRAGALFQPVVFDQFWWTLGLWGLLRRALDDAPAWWVLVGVAFGLGVLTKFSVAFIGVGVLAGVIVSSRRRDLATPWPWAAAALALALGAPSLAGQLALGWPVMGQMRDLAATQLERVTATEFLVGQLLQGPAALVAVVGLLRLVRDRAASGTRVVGVACAVAVLLLLVLHGKPYYAGPIYPVLFGAGASQLSQWGEAVAARRSRWAIRGVAALQAAYGLLILPMGLPVLPVEPMARYAAWLGGGTTTNTGGTLPLPQDYADMLGWRETVDSAAAVWRRLPTADQQTAALVGINYGRAGALDWYGPSRGLPRPVGPVGSFWFWGPGPRDGRVAVVVGGDAAFLGRYWHDVTLAATVRNPWRVEEEREVGVYVVRDAGQPLAALWRDFKGRN